MKIRIETVGSYDSGVGHVTRQNILAADLANALESEVALSVGGTAIEEGTDVVIVDVDRHAEAMLRITDARSSKTKIIVLFDNSEHGEDWDDLKHMSDVIIPNTWDYTILHPRMRTFERQGKLPEVINNIVVFMGGSDPWNLTPRVLYVLDNLRVRSRIHVLVGAVVSDMNISMLNAFHKTSSLFSMNLNMYYSLPLDGVAEVLSISDLGIIAPGNFFNECAAMQVPTIAISHHMRHSLHASELQSKGALIHLGIGGLLRDEDLRAGLIEAFDTMSSTHNRRGFINVGLRQVSKSGTTKIIEDIKNAIS